MSLHVLAPGPLCLVQDLGRPGLAHLGVGRSGAADRGALRLGNRLVGNREGAAGLEVLLGGLRLRAGRDLLVAVTGAAAPARVDGRAQGHAALLRLRAGAELALAVPDAGLRSYVCVRGGVDVPPVLGARSRDVLAALGPEPLRGGDVLPVGPPHAALPDVDHAPLGPLAAAVLPVLPGPRADHVRGGLAGAWQVAADSDRVALRLRGPALAHLGRPLASEGLLPGAVQVPPDGQPVLFLADAPVTGGYPVVGVVPSTALDRAAQLRPGDAVRLVPVPQ